MRLTMKKMLKGLSLVVLIAMSFNFVGCTIMYRSIMGREPSVQVIKAEVDYSRSFNKEDMANVSDNLRNISGKDSLRVPGTISELRVANFIRNTLESYGYEVSSSKFYTEFTMKTKLSLLSEDGKKYYDSYLNQNSADKFLSGSYELMDLGPAQLEEGIEYDFMDKIILLQIGYSDINDLVKIFEEGGAAGVIGYSPTADEIIKGSLKEKTKIPVISISREDGEELSQKIAVSEKAVKIELTDKEIKVSGNTRNLMVESDPSNKKNIILVSHYDSVTEDSSNSNATGVASLLKIAQQLSTQGVNDTNIIMVFMSGSYSSEGVDNFINRLPEEKKKNNLAVINIDSIGVGDSLEIMAEKNSVSDYMKSLGKSLGFKSSSKEISDNIGIGFSKAGFKTYTVSLNGSERQKNASDNLSKIKDDNIYRVTDLIINTLYQIK